MTKVAEKSLWRILPGRAISFVLPSLLLTILSGAKIASAQSASPSSLIVTPSTLVLLVGEDYALSAVDATGRPIQHLKQAARLRREWRGSPRCIERGPGHPHSHLCWPVRLGDCLHPFGLGPSASYRSVVT